MSNASVANARQRPGSEQPPPRVHDTQRSARSNRGHCPARALGAILDENPSRSVEVNGASGESALDHCERLKEPAVQAISSNMRIHRGIALTDGGLHQPPTKETRARGLGRNARPGQEFVVLVGARPNIPKAATVLRALDGLRGRVQITVVHSGQHHDDTLGEAFAKELGVEVDINLNAGSQTSDARQLGVLLSRIEEFLISRPGRPFVVVMGDVNTTVAGAMVAARQGLPVAHLEAGLRSHLSDPEEVNRKIITACSDFHLASSGLAVKNLRAEGIEARRVFLVGNAMAETFLLRESDRARSTVLTDLGLKARQYNLLTIHKPPTISNPEWLRSLLALVSDWGPTVFPCHPHTRSRLPHDVLCLPGPGLRIIDPLGYDDFGCLMAASRCVVTDSAGLQEEATIAGIPTATVGLQTARPETLRSGSNMMAGFSVDECRRFLAAPRRRSRRPRYWDVDVSKRLLKAFSEILNGLGTGAPGSESWNLR